MAQTETQIFSIVQEVGSSFLQNNLHVKVQTFLNKSRFRMQQNIVFESAKCTKLLIAILHYNINVQSDMCSVQCALVCISVH